MPKMKVAEGRCKDPIEKRKSKDMQHHTSRISAKLER
jgi:hypothetical protein